jgi:hypothetical protein
MRRCGVDERSTAIVIHTGVDWPNSRGKGHGPRRFLRSQGPVCLRRAGGSPSARFCGYRILDSSRDLPDVVAIKQEVEELLERHVHMVTEAAINQRIRDAVLKDAVPL